MSIPCTDTGCNQCSETCACTRHRSGPALFSCYPCSLRCSDSLASAPLSTILCILLLLLSVAALLPCAAFAAHQTLGTSRNR